MIDSGAPCELVKSSVNKKPGAEAKMSSGSSALSGGITVTRELREVSILLMDMTRAAAVSGLSCDFARFCM